LFDELTATQRTLFKLTFPARYPLGVPADQLARAIDIAERTIAKNEAEGRT
jgi:DNA-binding XRE family transcriptional regulator